MFVYLGLSSWLELNQSDFEGINEGFRLLVNPHFGLNGGSKRTKLNLEVKYYSPYIKVEQTGVPYYSPFGGYGALGLHLGLYRLF